MADTQVYVTTLNSGTPIDNISVTTGAGVVNRQRTANVADGTTGTDYSPTKPSTLGNLLTTVGSNATRTLVGVQNQSAEQIQVLLDTGTGSQTTYILLESGGAANTGGGAWTEQNFKGRVRVYSSNASSQVAVYEH